MDKTISKKKVTISVVLALVLLMGCDEQEWPTDPPDLTRPLVVSSSPEDGSFKNPVADPLVVTFSEAMDLSTFNDSLTTVMDRDGNIVAGSWTGSGVDYTFTPQSDFIAFMTYYVTMQGAFNDAGEWLGPAIRDKNGNSMQNDVNLSFSTGGNYHNTTLYLGTGGSNPGILAYAQDFAVSEFESYPGAGVQTPAINPAGTIVYVASQESGEVIVVDVASNAITAQIAMPDTVGFEGGPRTLAVTPDGSEVLVTSNGATLDLVVINATTNQVEAVVELDDYAGDCHSMAINNAGTRAYITTNWDAGVIVVDIPGRTVIEYLEDVATVESATAVAVSPDDANIIVFLAWAEDEIAVIDAATNAITYMSLGSGGDGWKIDVEGNYIYACGRWNGVIYKIDMTDMSIAAEADLEWQEYTGIALDTDGEVVYAIAPSYNEYEGGVLILTESDLALVGAFSAGAYRGMVTP